MIDPRRWSLFSKFEVPNFDDPEQTYLIRYRICQTPLFGIYLHRMDGPDSRPTLHDHPWNAWCFLLKGGYVEKRLRPKDMSVYVRLVKRVNHLGTYDAHAILELMRVPTWTLVFSGRRVRTWGYWEPVNEPLGWEYAADPSTKMWAWTRHDQHFHQREFDKAMEVRARKK